jgi:uncharacterized protein (TIGR02145 family)
LLGKQKRRNNSPKGQGDEKMADIKKVVVAAISIALALAFFACTSGGNNNNGNDGNSSNCTQTGIINGPSVNYGGETYESVVICGQTWLKRNLNYNPSSGTTWCYGNKESYCDTYGRLYDWATAMNLPRSCNGDLCSDQVSSKHKGICPSGWHIPSYEEWETLINYAGGKNTAGRKLKTASGWNDNDNGTDDYGFSALPGGYVSGSGPFYDVGSDGKWWSARESDEYGAYIQRMGYDGHADSGGGVKAFGFSVRCVQD